ncbi:MAG: hypothetical protein K0R68_1745 [Mycobacterium sp.]|jgi:CHAD domain-containing protein|nr:hypothetical protein [Mycobacterium sp.]
MLKLTERETKWDVDQEFRLPDLTDVVSGAQVQHDTLDTVSAYFDTEDAALQAHGIVLRRRDGQDDTGWQLTTPGGDDLFWPLSDVPPDEVVGLLTGVTGGARLHNIGTIHTVRHRHCINDAESDEVIARIVEDQVRASNGDRLLAWKEIEVELGPQAPRQFEKLLKKAGATPSRYPTKLAHLAGTVPPVESASPAVQAITHYVHTQIDAIVAGDLGLRRGLDPIHDTRVALRRLRSTLRVFAPLFDQQALALEDDLKWFAGLLGDVRDAQVQQGRFDEALEQVPDELVLGPVRARIRADLQAIELPARARAGTEMGSPRYLGLLGELTTWRTSLPLRPGVSGKDLRNRAAKAAHKADTRLAEALATPDGEDITSHGELLHRARKAAKRARYAAELIGSSRKVKQYKTIQSILGDHQDTVVARELLRRMGAAAGTTDGENGFTFGLLYAREESTAHRCVAMVQDLR